MARLSALSGLVLCLASGAQAFVPSPLARMNTAAKVAPRSRVSFGWEGRKEEDGRGGQSEGREREGRNENEGHGMVG
jgi:hypothetical protein